jgi:hypothetical protein
MALATKAHRKLNHTGRYLNFNTNYLPHVKRSLIQSLHNTTSTIYQEQDLFNELSSLRRDLQLNYNPQSFIDSVINSKGSSRLNKNQKPLGPVYIPYVNDVLGKFKRIGNQYNIRTIFKTTHTLRSPLMKPRSGRYLQQTAKCISSIPCECVHKLHWRNWQTSSRTAP